MKAISYCHKELFLGSFLDTLDMILSSGIFSNPYKSMMELFVPITNGWHLLTIVTKNSIADLANFLNPALLSLKNEPTQDFPFNTITKTWPDYKLHWHGFCGFSIVLQVWRLLFEKKHGINKINEVKIWNYSKNYYMLIPKRSLILLRTIFFQYKVFKKNMNNNEHFVDLQKLKQSRLQCF